MACKRSPVRLRYSPQEGGRKTAFFVPRGGDPSIRYQEREACEKEEANGQAEEGQMSVFHKFLIALSDRVFPPKPGTEHGEDERVRRFLQGGAIVMVALMILAYLMIASSSEG